DLLTISVWPRRGRATSRTGQVTRVCLPQKTFVARAIWAVLLAGAWGSAGCTGTVDGASKSNPQQPAASGGSTNTAIGGSGGSGGGAVTVGVAPFAPSEPALPRLTTAQYKNVIRDLFGPSIQV